LYESELLRIERAHGRVIAEDVFSSLDIPTLPSAAMDGYAIRAKDTVDASLKAPTSLKITNEVCELVKGCARDIMTGEPIPKGADAVIPYEKCEIGEGEIKVYSPVPKYGNVHGKGEKVRKGELLFKKGKVLKPYDLHVLATVGYRFIRVLRRPKVGLLSTGSELKDLEEYDDVTTGSATINSAKLMLEGLLYYYNVDVDYMGIVKDDLDEISKFLKLGIEKYDIVITTGGTALGKKDLVVKAIRALNPILLIHGLKIRPGKPTAIALLKNKPIVMLSGVPEAAFIGFELVARPILLKMLGRRDVTRPRVKGKLVKDIPSARAKRALRVNVFEKDEEILVEPYSISGNGILILSENMWFNEKDEVEVMLLDAIEKLS
jgi:molybdopterin molybdotransferase